MWEETLHNCRQMSLSANALEPFKSILVFELRSTLGTLKIISLKLVKLEPGQSLPSQVRHRLALGIQTRPHRQRYIHNNLVKG